MRQMNDRMKNNYKKNGLIIGLFWLASLVFIHNFSYAQTEVTVDAPVEILIAEPDFIVTSEASALFKQAKKFHDGDGVQQDFARAHALYLEAAQKGNNSAKINLGYLYFMGEGVDQNYEEARNWYLSAAKNGSKYAQLNLAMIYRNGFGVPKSNTDAEYWRTYDQIKTIQKKSVAQPVAKPVAKPVAQPVVKAPVKLANVKKPVTSRPVASRPVASKPVVSKSAAPKLAAPKPVAALGAENKPKVDNINLAIIEKQADIVPQAEQSIPKTQLLTPQAKEGFAGIGGTITVLNKEAVIPEQIRALQNLPRLGGKPPHILSQWISNVIAAMMLILVIATSIWFFDQYTEIRKQKKARVFARAFYAHHRDRLRINYLRYPQKHRKIDGIDDSWAVALCVLMVRFAQSQKDDETLVGIQSNKIVQALKESPFKAKQAVFPFVKITQHRIFEDIQAHEYKYKGAAQNDDETIMAEPQHASENGQPTQVKLHSDSNEAQKSLLKENDLPDITE